MTYNPAFGSFRLRQDDTTATEESCISARRLASLYFPFHASLVAPFVANKQGVTVEAVKRDWEESLFLSKMVRSRIPPLMMGYRAPTLRLPPNSKLQTIIRGADAAVERIRQDFDVLAVDEIVADREFKIATIIDFIARSKATNRLLIGGWRISGSPKPRFFVSDFDESAVAPWAHIPNTQHCRSSFAVFVDGFVARRSGVLHEMTATNRVVESLGPTDVDYGVVTVRRGMFDDVTVEFRRMEATAMMPVDSEDDDPDEVFTRFLSRWREEQLHGAARQVDDDNDVPQDRDFELASCILPSH